MLCPDGSPEFVPLSKIPLENSRFTQSAVGRLSAAKFAVEIGAYREAFDHAEAAIGLMRPEYERSLDMALAPLSAEFHRQYQRALGFLGTACIGLGQFDKAISVLTEALGVDTYDAEDGRSQRSFLLSKSVVAHLGLGDLTGALQCFSSLKSTAPVDREHPAAPHLALAKAGYHISVRQEQVGAVAESEESRNFALKIFAERERIIGNAVLSDAEKAMRGILRWTAENGVSPGKSPPKSQRSAA